MEAWQDGGVTSTPIWALTDSDFAGSLAFGESRWPDCLRSRVQVVQDGKTTCLIGLGGNTGPVADTFAEALDMLDAAGCHPVSCSGCYQSPPMGANAGGAYTNAAACVTTVHSPLQLLDLLQAVERRSGRVRTVHWGPRPLDLDLLFYGQQVIRTDRLSVPHAGVWYRRFVLDPLVEIAPEWRHPGNSHTIRQLRARLDQRPLVIEVDGAERLPLIPDRCAEGVVQIRSFRHLQSGSSPFRMPFCVLHVHGGNPHSRANDEAVPEDFRIDVAEENLAEMIDVILSAALGI